MKKHEQQTSSLEEMSNFFGGQQLFETLVAKGEIPKKY